MKSWAGMHRVMIELTPDEARDLELDAPAISTPPGRLAYLADVADGLVRPVDAADATEPATDLVCGTCGLTTNALPCPHCSTEPTTDLAELTVHERLCLCADCEAEHAAKHGRYPADHSPDLLCVCDVCEPRI